MIKKIILVVLFILSLALIWWRIDWKVYVGILGLLYAIYKFPIEIKK